jgi:hypothetical protein
MKYFTSLCPLSLKLDFTESFIIIISINVLLGLIFNVHIGFKIIFNNEITLN